MHIRKESTKKSTYHASVEESFYITSIPAANGNAPTDG